MTLVDMAVVLFGAFCGGFVSGLAGFGTGITAMGIWLFALPPSVAATLVIVCSVAAQLQTLPKVWHAIDPGRVTRFVVPGLVGVLPGTLLLAYLDPRSFKILIALLLFIYSLWQLAWRGQPLRLSAGRAVDGFVGLLGGVFGGLAGLSGPLLVIWSSFKSWSRDERRSTLQAYNGSILVLALLSHLLAGQFTRELLYAIAVALPGTLLGACAGSRLYVSTSEEFYQRILLVLLMFSAIILIGTNW